MTFHDDAPWEYFGGWLESRTARTIEHRLARYEMAPLRMSSRKEVLTELGDNDGIVTGKGSFRAHRTWKLYRNHQFHCRSDR
ncbi:hypothetical protein HY632_04755 [Candidatus Uhrbacteria bacterium]|nr:hypothetical protein [Candidatus Uhrbacteria bacterium]